MRKRSKDGTAEEARVQTKAKVTAAKKKFSPEVIPAESSSPKNGPLTVERRLTRRMTASIQTPNSSEKTSKEIQNNSTKPTRNKESTAYTETVERADEQNTLNDEPSSRRRKMGK